ncbi:hypothetical protein ABBQ32_013779 [Trebouxia sp. C0010 RCD-2024]
MDCSDDAQGKYDPAASESIEPLNSPPQGAVLQPRSDVSVCGSAWLQPCSSCWSYSWDTSQLWMTPDHRFEVRLDELQFP